VAVIVTHYERPRLLLECLAALRQQTYPAALLDVVVVDDASPSGVARRALAEDVLPVLTAAGWRLLPPGPPRSYLGAARNRGAAAALAKAPKPAFLLFLDDDDLAAPDMIERLVLAATTSGVDVLSTFFSLFSDDGDDGGGTNSTVGHPPPSLLPLPEARVHGLWAFLGPYPALGALDNVYGGANIFCTRAAWVAVGGFSELWGVGYEDYEWLGKAILAAGLRHEVLPVPLLYVRATPGSMQRSSDRSAAQWRALAPLLAHYSSGRAELDLSDLLLLAWRGLYKDPVPGGLL